MTICTPTWTLERAVRHVLLDFISDETKARDMKQAQTGKGKICVHVGESERVIGASGSIAAC